jgi:hypothetical protein
MDTFNEFGGDGGGGAGMDRRYASQDQFLDQQSAIPYLPYAQQGPYQAIMNQMGGFGGASGTGYQQGMGALYGGGAGGGYDPNLYKRAAAAAPLAPAIVDNATRGGGSSGGGASNYGSGSGLAQFGGSGFSAGASPYANQLSAFLGNMGFTGISDALAKNVNPNYGNEGMNAPPTVVGNTNYSNEGLNKPAPISTAAAVADYSRNSDGISSVSDRTLANNISGQDAANARDSLAKGGHIMPGMLSGPNPAGPDDGYHSLKTGEFVINDKAVKKYGIELMDAINSGKISKGKLRGLLEM